MIIYVYFDDVGHGSDMVVTLAVLVCDAAPALDHHLKLWDHLFDSVVTAGILR